MDIDFSSIEKKWQDRWASEKTFEVSGDSGKNPFYVLEMFPYPSGTGLHMGHALNYTIGDILARFKTMKGFEVLHPMGFDALGLPAENAAIKAGTHPEEYTNSAIKNYMKQQKALGVSYDWSRMVNTASPDYYKWDQWIFLKMLEKGLAYQKTSAVNWCPKCNTVLANEQVEDGRCWRHEETGVKIKKLKQWFFKTTEYANELYENLDNMDWPERTKAMQKNWIGRSEGTEIEFEISKLGKDIEELEFVFLHAYGNNSKNSFWIWLKKEIESRGGKVVFAPDLPNTNNPDYEEQSKFVLDNYNFNENTVVIGHCLGNILMMKLLSDNKIMIHKFIMVAPPLPKKDDIISGAAFVDSIGRSGLAKYCDWKFDFDAIKKNIVSSTVLIDEKDHIVLEYQPLEIAKKLGSSVVKSIANATHYNGEREEKVLEALFEKWPIFTTRPDTIFGVTFMVVSAQHEKLDELVTPEQKDAVDKFLEKIKSVSEKDSARTNKEGVFSGSYAINPANGERVPIWVGNFVVADYGSGMVMAVPAHDKRDFEFAKKYGIEIKQVVNGGNIKVSAFVGNGILINSGKFNGLNNIDAKEKITDWLIEKGVAKRVVNFKLRDWGISRQRYWGTPIPIVYCDKCGVVPVSEEDLPVKLPKNVKFGDGNPLETAEDWVKTKCPKCGGEARRETDTMDTFVNSSWYFLRYTDPNNSEKIFEGEKANYWCPVDVYIGGAEHACMHLIYSRFYVKFLRDLGLINFDEPAIKLFHQGMLRAEDGKKMSKSLGNVINPLDTIKKFGVDATRWFLISVASPDKDFDWSEKGIMGTTRFIGRVYNFYSSAKYTEDSPELLSKLNLTIKNLEEYYGNFGYRKATIELRELFDLIEKGCSENSARKFLKLITPITPHVAEELWEKIGGKDLISNATWPKIDKSKILDNKQDFNLNKKIIERVRKIIKPETKKVYVYVMPFEMDKINKEQLENEIGKVVSVFAVNDSSKYDPKNMAKKAKPGMAGIYLE